jgi:hypothetical protein
MRKKNNKDVLDETTENWHKPEYNEDPDNAPRTFQKPPKRFEANFLAKMDRRTEIFQQLKTAYDEITADCGGAENLSHVMLALCERFVFLEFTLQNLEARIADNPKNADEFISKWIQACNSVTGLAKTLGLEKRVRKVKNLREYVEGKAQ